MKLFFGRVSNKNFQDKDLEDQEELVNVWYGSPEDHYVLTCLSLYYAGFDSRGNGNSLDEFLMPAIEGNCKVINPAYIMERAEALGISEIRPVWNRLRELQSQKTQRSNGMSTRCRP